MNKKEIKKGIISYFVLFGLMLVIFYLFTLSNNKVNKFSYDEFINHMNNNEINDELIVDLADFFKNFSDSSRLRILNELGKGDVSVNTLAETLNMSQSAVSHQLKTLKASKLVKGKQEGKNVFYSLDDEHVKGIIDYALVHIMEGNNEK